MKTAEEVLIHAIDLLTAYLIDLSDTRNTRKEQFAYGEKTAYTECLEVIAEWEHAKEYGLDFEVEERFPL